MRDRRLRRWLAILLFFVVPFGPRVALAQESRAGVVTTVEGQALLARPTLTQPLGLKFKDDLFARDRIETKEDSIVRVLLGGKAVVTIRELSVFTVTEEPGRAALDLRSGKLAVGVAKSLLRAGEVIEIRTPNAVAGIRGSLLVAEVAEVGGVPQSAFTALQATVPITIATLANPNLTVSLSPNQTVSVSGAGAAATLGPVLNITPAQAQRAAATAAAPRQTGLATTSLLDSQMTTTQVAQAAGLASLIAPASQTLLKTAGVVSVVPTPSTAQLGVNQTEAGAVAEVVETAKPDMPDITIKDTILDVPPGGTLKTYTGTSSRTGTSPVALISNSQVSGPGSLLAAAPGADVSLNGPLLEMSGPSVQASILTAGANVVDIQGRLADTTTSALLQFDPTLVVSGNEFIRVSNGGNLGLAGPLVSAAGTSFKVGDPTANVFGFLSILDGSTVMSVSPSSLLSFDGSSVDTSGNIVTIRRSPSPGAPSKLLLSGPLLSAVNGSSFNTSSLGLGAGCCSFVSITQGGQLVGAGTTPLIQLSGSTINAGPDAQSGAHFFNIADTFTNAPAGDLVAPSSVSLTGPLVRADNSTFTTLFNFLRVGNSTLTSTSPDPLIQLSGTTVNIGGIDPFTGATAASRIVLVTASSTTAAALNLQGALLNATNSAITSGNEILGVFNGATLASTGTGSLLSINGGSATAGTAVALGSGGNFISFASNLGLSPSVSLAGPLLGAVNTSLKNGNPTSNTYSFVFVGDGATVTSTSGAPLFSFDNTSLDTSGGFLSLRRSLSIANPSSITLSGPLFAATNGSIFDVTSTAFGSACCTGFHLGQGARLSSTSTAPLIQLSNSTFNAGPDPQSGGHLVAVVDTGACCGDTNLLLVAPSSVSLKGPLLSATGSTITALFSLVQVTRSSVTSTSPDPLIQLSGTPVSLGGIDPFTNQPAGATLLDVFSGQGGSNAPATVSLQGPFLQATNSPLTTSATAIGIFNGATLTSVTTKPFVLLDNSPLTTGALFGGNFLNVSGLGGAAGATAPAASFAGPILVASNGSNVNLGGGVIGIFNGATLTSGTPNAFVLLDNTSVTTGSNTGGDFLNVSGTPSASASFAGPLLVVSNGSSVILQRDVIIGSNNATITGTGSAPFIQVIGGSLATGPSGAVAGLGNGTKLNLAGPLLSVASTLTAPGGLANISNGGQLTVTGSTDPLVSFSGGSATVAGNSGSSMFNLLGAATAVDAESRLTLGTNRLIQGTLQQDGTRPLLSPLLETTGATVTGQQVVKIDTALLEATAPLLNLKAGSVMTSSADAINLNSRANVILLSGSDLVRLDASTLNVSNGALARVAGGSKFTVGGNLVNLLNGATLTVFNGPLITVSGSSFVTITGSLINFGGTGGNKVNITNSLCPCSIIGGVPVALQNGASAANVQITNPIKNAGLGQLNLSSANAALAVVNGTNTKLKVTGQ